MSVFALRWLPRLIEIDVLLLIAISPWLFGGAESFSYYAITLTLSVALLLWALRILLEWRFSLRNSPALWCLVALLAFGMWQAVRLPKSILAAISPQTSAFYDKLLPANEERVSSLAPSEDYKPRNGTTISFYPTETMKAASDLLAVVALFALIQNNLATIGFLRRLSILTLFNGSLMAIFAIIQFYSSPHDHIFWKIPIKSGQVFGTFICRNHFSFYTNISVGLSLGLLLSALPASASSASRPRKRSPSSSTSSKATGRTLSALASRILQPLIDTLRIVFSHPAFLWVGSSIALVIAATVLSSSRGGLLSISLSLAILFLLRRSLQPSAKGLAPVILLAAIGASAFFAWLGPGRIDRYIAIRWSGHNLDNRLPLWKAAWPLVGEYPVLGTGYGTFQYVEPLHRDEGSESLRIFTFEHAHNEYLEAQVEGGIIRLAISCLAILLVYTGGFANIRKLGQAPDAGLIMGALCGFTTVVIHSGVDFGLHIPAIAILTTTVAALLCTPLAGRATKRVKAPGTSIQPARPSLIWIWVPPIAALGLLSIASLLSLDAYARHLAQLYRAAALKAQRANGPLEHQIEYLLAVTKLTPGSAEAQQELGQNLLDAYEANLSQAESLQSATSVCRLFLMPICGYGSFDQILAASIGERVVDIAAKQGEIRKVNHFEQAYLSPALQHFIEARDLCPLLVRPHLRLAAHHQLLESSGTQQDHWERAKLIAPQDPELWYYSGLYNLALGDQDKAWADFKESLRWSNRYLGEILGQTKPVLRAAEIVEKVLPGNPDTQLAACQSLFPDASDPERKAFLEKVVQQIDRGSGLTSSIAQRTKGLILLSLGKSADAVMAYRIGLSLDPENNDLRIELAELLLSLNRNQEARNELVTVLAHDSNNARAKALFGASTIQARPPQLDPRPIKAH